LAPGVDPKGETGQFEVARFAGLGLTWALSVLLFLGGGWWLDQRLGITPVLTILGAFTGAGAGFYYMYLEVVVRRGGDR
jgi:hypothetical protein